MSAPKQLLKRRKLEKKRLRKRESRIRRQRRQRSSWYEPVSFDAPGGVKMSDVLAGFVGPLAGDWQDAEAYRRLLTLGLVAWNAALQPPSEQQHMVDDVIGKGLSGESQYMRQMCREIVDRLILRKQTHFAQYRRPILNFALEDRGGGDYFLSVISVLDV